MRVLPLLALATIIIAGCRSGDKTMAPPAESDDGYGLDMVANGKLSFERYCVSCHGADAKGDGPVASELVTKPADLTSLSNKYDGVFPSATIYDYIDGRTEVAAHGTRMMPVWGNIWSEHQGEDMVDLRIREIVAYLETLQADQN
ncbi:MAG: c-type cytochrome [Bacteroidetes bacterium]|nr:c-type cytochrome [Bacteroidota bacterium]